MTLLEFVRSRPLRWSVALVCALGGCVVTNGCGVKMNANDPPAFEPVRQYKTCSEMCLVLSRFECDAALPSPRLGITCTERCERAMAVGAITPPIDCVASATSEAAILACGERCR